MNIFLTNDDGYDQQGILILKKVLQKYGTVYLVAPHEHQSGESMHFSIQKGFHVYKHDDYTYSITGTPVDVVLLGTQILDVKFDVIVSGCNDGLNISYDTMYSGTIGAALEGLNHGIPSIAISTYFGNFDVVEKEATKALDYIFKNKLISNRYCLNVNFPMPEFKESKGIIITKEFFKKDIFEYWIKNGLYYTDRTKEIFDNAPEGTDVYAVSHGYTSICPITNSHFNIDIYNEIKNK